MSIMLSNKDAYRVMFKEYPDVVTADQMSEMLGISSKTAYRILQEYGPGNSFLNLEGYLEGC